MLIHACIYGVMLTVMMHIAKGEQLKMINWKGVLKDRDCSKSSLCFLPNHDGRLNKGMQFIWHEIIQSILSRAKVKSNFIQSQMKVPSNIVVVLSATVHKAKLMHKFCLIREDNIKKHKLNEHAVVYVSHRSPCGTVQHFPNNAVFAKWLITVHSSFMINITIHKAYVPFSEWCRPDFLVINEGHQLRAMSMIESFCGHILLESVYTMFNKAMLMSVNPAVLTHLTASYQVHQQGYAYRFIGNQLFKFWQHYSIAVQDRPKIIIYASRHIEYVWHYVTPHLLAYQPFSHPVVASITKFICSTKLSFLVMKEGLLPIQWVKQYGQHFLCNSSTPFNISLSKHMYFTILLSREIFEPNFTFKMTFALQTEIAAGNNISHIQNKIYPMS